MHTESQLQAARLNLVTLLDQIRKEESDIENRSQELTCMGISVIIGIQSIEDDLLDLGAIPEEHTVEP